MRLMLCLLAGPFAGRRLPAAVAGLLLAVVLTTLTQIGGIMLWLALGAGARVGKARGIVALAVFVVGYGVATAIVVPSMAPAFGRVPLACHAAADRPYAAVSPLYCVLNRNYVRPPLRDELAAVAGYMAARHPGTVVRYLDAGFPFGGTPLLPHLSHGDGRRLDLVLFYEGRPAGGAWFIGYWAFAPAQVMEAAPACAHDGVLRWRMAALQGLFDGLHLDSTRSADMLRFLARRPAIRRIFVEPYLKVALGVDAATIGFAGCGAARHDDHIHIETG